MPRGYGINFNVHWSKGGAIANSWKCKLWTGISHALFDLESWNFAHICHSSQGKQEQQSHTSKNISIRCWTKKHMIKKEEVCTIRFPMQTMFFLIHERRFKLTALHQSITLQWKSIAAPLTDWLLVMKLKGRGSSYLYDFLTAWPPRYCFFLTWKGCQAWWGWSS